MKRKFKNQRGESLIETIAAMLIISLGMLMLAGAIVTSARVNKRASSETVQVVPPRLPNDTGWSQMADDTEWVSADGRWKKSTGWLVQVCDGDGNASKLPVTIYEAVPEGGGDNGKQVLYYYEIAP